MRSAPGGGGLPAGTAFLQPSVNFLLALGSSAAQHSSASQTGAGASVAADIAAFVGAGQSVQISELPVVSPAQGAALNVTVQLAHDSHAQVPCPCRCVPASRHAKNPGTCAAEGA
jgi:hypothetical protein